MAEREKENNICTRNESDQTIKIFSNWKNAAVMI